MASITYTTPSTDPTAPSTIKHATVPFDRIRPRPPTASTPDLNPRPTHPNPSDPDSNPQSTHPNPSDQTTRPPPPTTHPNTPSHGPLRGMRKNLLDRWKHPYERSKPRSPTTNTPAPNPQPTHSDPDDHTTQPLPSAAFPSTPPLHSLHSARSMRKKLMWEYRWKQDEAEAPPTPKRTQDSRAGQSTRSKECAQLHFGVRHFRSSSTSCSYLAFNSWLIWA